MSAQVIPLTAYGAPADAWLHFSILLGLTADLLPVVSNPNARISPDSKMRDLGKTPSRYNRQRLVAGIKDWTDHQASHDDIEQWSKEPDYGICLQTRTVRAIDVDIPDGGEATAVRAFIAARHSGFPARTRANSTKFLLAFTFDGELTKRRIVTRHGVIELLATGQQFVAVGQHPSGARYEWCDGLPDAIPVLSSAEVEQLWADLQSAFGTQDSSQDKPSTKREVLAEAITTDPVAAALYERGMVLSSDRDGKMHIACPWDYEHTTASAESSTTYFPPHTGGFEKGNFKCLHAHCSHRTVADLRDKLDVFETDDFDVLPDAPAADPEKPLRFQIQPAHEFAQGVAPEWLIKGVLPRATLGVVFGDPGSGKTFLTLDWCAAIALGNAWRERRVRAGRVVYIVAEGAHGFRNRLKAYAEFNALDLAHLDIGVLADAPNFMEKADVKDLLTAIRARGTVDLIVVDTFAQVMPGGNENAGEDVGKVLAHCRALHKHTGAMVLLVHHSGKDAAKGARGWSGLRGAVDVEIEISRQDEARVATITKMKDGEDGSEFGFRLHTVGLGQDADGEAITSCVIEHSDGARAAAQAGSARRIKGDNERVVWNVANDLIGLSSESVAPVDVIDAAVAQMPVLDPSKRDRRREVVLRALQKLISDGFFRVEGNRLELTSAQ